MLRGLVVCVLLALAPAPAHADGGADLIYAEALGKGGLYGLGYEHAITGRLSLGAAASFAIVRDQQLATVAWYVHGTLVGRARHRLFTEVGAILAHSRLPSPVDGWGGMADTGGGGFVSLGWERATRHLVLRVSGAVAVGEGGLAPMVGLAIGARP